VVRGGKPTVSILQKRWWECCVFRDRKCSKIIVFVNYPCPCKIKRGIISNPHFGFDFPFNSIETVTFLSLSQLDIIRLMNINLQA